MSRQVSNRSTRGILSLGLLVVGVLLLALVPAYVLLMAFTGAKEGRISGTVLIVSVVGGMASILISSALRA